MHDNAEHDQSEMPRVVNAGMAEWVKFALTIIGTTIMCIGWAEARFVSRIEWTNHTEQQRSDLAAMKETQGYYANEEKGTSRTLSEINSRLTRIETLLERPFPVNGKK